ncbi:MAG TPA: alkaline phosphatase family protein [Candidatus Cybelea sp.]|jgi:phospholipase C|nr:alkaline phosphatase family protein [Candidatus Cybelea sp.]
MSRSALRARLLPLSTAFFTLSALTGIATALPGCGGGSTPSVSAPVPPPPPAKKGKYFTHIVIMIQENRSFDNLFATYPGADGTRVGKTHNGTLALREANLQGGLSPNHGYTQWLGDWNHGKMNGFDLVPIGHTPGTYVYQYVNPSQVAPYWQMAKAYVLADHLFQTQGSGSFTAHQDLIRGGTDISATQSVIDYPTRPPWGCDAPAGTVTSLITAANQFEPEGGPRPCFTYSTLRDSLDAKSLSWRYYAPQVGDSIAGDQWNAFDAISAVRYGPEWSTNEINPETQVFTDISRDTLPAVSWVIPDFQNSDHPASTSDTGPSWITQVVNAIGQSPAWDSTAIVVVWDDWGGWYDHVAPPTPRRFGGPGFRVPALVIAPYAKRNYVSHNVYQFGSIIRFVEENWNLPTLGTTDETSASFVSDFFDFTQHPRKFASFDSKYDRSYFLHQKPSNRPVDDH